MAAIGIIGLLVVLIGCILTTLIMVIMIKSDLKRLQQNQQPPGGYGPPQAGYPQQPPSGPFPGQQPPSGPFPGQQPY